MANDNITSTTNYIGINGLVTQDLEAIKDDLTTKFKSIYGEDINLEQNSPDGQLINILAQEKKDILDLFTQYYNNLDPDRVIGIPQQILYKLNGLIINAYTYSFVYITVTLSELTTLQGLDDNLDNADGTGYTVRDINGNRWILTTTATLPSGKHILNFRAADLGAITALPNTISIMETVQKGVVSVTNEANNYITGNSGETSAQFRQRRNQSMAIASQGFDESIQSQILNLPNVTQCKVYDNRTNNEENGIPPHTVWIIVEGGTPSEIARTIYANLPPGIPMKGEQSVVITKTNGDLETIYYDLPKAVDLKIKATIKNFTSTPLDEENIKSKLSDNTYLIGERVETADITADLKEILGQTGSPFEITISQDGTTWEEYLTPTGLDEFFVITPDNITLTIE